MPFTQWAAERHIDITCIDGKEDLQSARIFPVVYDTYGMQLLLRWMIDGRQELSEEERDEALALWQEARRLSADDISNEADLERLTRQRNEFRASSWASVAKNYRHSVFYQVDLSDAASRLRNLLPTPLRC